MKRLHVSVAVKDLTESVRFYSILFGAEPTVIKPDYAKWMLEDPRVNFAISTRSKRAGLDHLGIQVDSKDELGEVTGRLASADQSILDQNQATCCYARSDKAWVADPQGIAWETFFSFGQSAVYGEDGEAIAELTAGPTPASQACCVRT
jgi:catechol 2,3-dioxygenase-like lactoylglutathione lyase family enzyme